MAVKTKQVKTKTAPTKTTKQTKAKLIPLQLNVPDQRHLSYLSDAHSIYNQVRVMNKQHFMNFENFLLDMVFIQAGTLVKQWEEFKKAKIAELQAETEKKAAAEKKPAAKKTKAKAKTGGKADVK